MAPVGDRTSFLEKGYAIYPNLLSPQEVEQYKSRISAFFNWRKKPKATSDRNLNVGYSSSDAITATQEFWDLIFHDKLTSFIRYLLGPTARYTQHSDLHLNHGTVGWHRDCANRDFGVGPDWDERNVPYRVVRVAIYLQSYAESKFSLGVIPSSHQHESILTTLERKSWNVLMGRMLKKKNILQPLLSVKPTWIPTNPGDCIVFNQRLLHSGSYCQGEKYAMFLSYGIDNEHSKRHRRYYLYDRKDLSYSDCPEALKQRLIEQNLYLGVTKED